MTRPPRILSLKGERTTALEILQGLKIIMEAKHLDHVNGLMELGALAVTS
jgi:hypothetical protein